MKSKVPLKKQRVFNISVRDDLLDWWDRDVEPAIKNSGMTRTAFIMEAVREKVDRA